VTAGRWFGGVAAQYARSRPGYAVEAVRWALPGVPCRVVDVGAGTGKLTEALVGLGCDVVAVEPDEAMRAEIRDAEALAGTAEELPLADASVDAVVAGQAFHWFDGARFLVEAARVLRPNGTVGLLWNWLDDRVPWVGRLAELGQAVDRLSLVEREDAYRPFDGARVFGGVERVLVQHVQPMTPELLVDLVASRSRSIALPAAERAELLAQVRALGEAQGPEFALPYVTNAWRAVRTPA
jgi:SAM-dependent methyltransferase